MFKFDGLFNGVCLFLIYIVFVDWVKIGICLCCELISNGFVFNLGVVKGFMLFNFMGIGGKYLF